MIRSAMPLSSQRRAVFLRVQREWLCCAGHTTSRRRHYLSWLTQTVWSVTGRDGITRIRHSSVSSPSYTGGLDANHFPAAMQLHTSWPRCFSTDPSDGGNESEDATTADTEESQGSTHTAAVPMMVTANDLENTAEDDATVSATDTSFILLHKKNEHKSKHSHRGDNPHQRRLVNSQMKRFKVLQIELKLNRHKNIQKDFEKLARHMELSKLKGMERLYKELQNELKEMRQEANGQRNNKRKYSDVDVEVDPQRRLWRRALEFFAKRKVPKELKEVFVQRLVVSDKKNLSDAAEEVSVIKQQQAVDDDIALLQKARAVAVQHPMFWSREWTRKIRKALKKRKVAAQLLEDATAESDENNTNNIISSSEESDENNNNNNIISSSEAYTAMIRIPALKAQHDKRTDTQHYAEAASFQAKMQDRLSPQQYRHLLRYLQDYVDACEANATVTEIEDNECSDDDGDSELDAKEGDIDHTHAGIESDKDAMNDSFYNTLDLEPNKDNDDTNVPFADVVEVVVPNKIIDKQTAPQQQKHTQQQLRVLKSNLLKFIPENRFNLVAQDVSEFFFVTASDELVENTLGADQLTAIVQEDRIVRISQTQWNDAREIYLKCFQQIHKMLLRVKTELPPIIGNATGVEADSTEDSTLETIADVAATKPTGNQVPVSTERMKPRKYVAFEAMEIGQPLPRAENADEGGMGKFDLSSAIHLSSNKILQPLDSEAFPIKAPTDRMVFIDNLPIDITKDRLLHAYGRVGEIDALEIFHYRPELDPGRKAIDDRKKIRNPSSTSRRQKWQRPRTPLYGMVLYKEPEAAAKAVADPLRIFGMVLDKHLMRSHRSTDMTKLYLEDVNPTHDITAIEYDLSRILHPDLYVCLDVSAHRRRRPRMDQVLDPLSCVIQLPSFEAAYWAYLKLHMELEYLHEDESSCALHWMETPADAMLYWTRQLNF